MLQVTSATLFIIASISIIIGFVAGGIIGYTNNRKRKKKEEETPEDSEQNQTAPPLVDPEQYTELVRLWRAKEGAGLYVETSGHLLASSEPLNEKQKNRFIDLLKELAEWVKIPPADLSENLVEPAPPPVETYASSSVEAPHLTAAAAVKTAPIPPPPAPSINGEAPQPVPVPVPSKPAAPAPKPTPKPAVDAAKKTNGSMVEQIDDILQEVIENSEKPDRKIRLVEEPNEGVAVWVGNDHFIGIDAVPDPIVKDLIRKAVREWDRRTEK